MTLLKCTLFAVLTLAMFISADAQTGSGSLCPTPCPNDSGKCYNINWRYLVDRPGQSQGGDAFELTMEGDIYWMDVGSHQDKWKLIHHVDPDVYCEMVNIVKQNLPVSDHSPKPDDGQYTINMVGSNTPETYYANWSRTDRTEESSTFIRVYLRLSNIIPPTALDPQK